MSARVFITAGCRQAARRQLVQPRQIGSSTRSRRSLATSCRLFQEQAQQQQQLQQQRRRLDTKQLQPSGDTTLFQEWPTTSRLELMEPLDVARVPAYRVLNPDGSLEGDLEPALTEEKIVELYEKMIQLNVFDKIMFDSQRQGRISFYMTNFGEEAVAFGSAAALDQGDWIYAQYREAGILLERGMSLKLMLAQCYGNNEDLGKGRQMPIHYGNRKLNFAPISSPLTVQLPQAAGTAYAFKLQQQNQIVATYFGEGAASEGDAHAAMNFAATLTCPIIFFCRNNGYAISTPTSEQYASDGIVNRGLGYGMNAVRVDGNDLFAVFAATRRARELCLRESRPCLIEAMTYRVGHHSTSDDSLAYRSADEIRRWDQEVGPTKRLFNYLCANKLWSNEKQEACTKEARARVLEALSWAERRKKLPIGSMFEDVYDELPANLRRQRDELKQHLESYGDHYPLDEHDGF